MDAERAEDVEAVEAEGYQEACVAYDENEQGDVASVVDAVEAAEREAQAAVAGVLVMAVAGAGSAAGGAAVDVMGIGRAPFHQQWTVQQIWLQ